MSLFSIFSKKPPEPTSVAEALAGAVETSAPKSKNRRAENRDAQNEQLVPEKKRARRRLIGAVAIVLAVVIGLPMVLDSEPKPINKNVVIQIPSKEPITTSTEPEIVKDAAANKTPKPAALTEADTPQRTVQTVTTPAVAEVVGPAPAKVVKPDSKTETKHSADVIPKKDSEPKNRPDAKSESKSQVKPVAKPDAKIENKVTEVHTKTEEMARAQAILSGADPVAKPKTRIVVQVGAFATQEKVTELQDKLSAAGIKSFTQKVATSSGDKIRVRIGPFSDRESADKVKLQLEKLGLNASLISL